jgi:hypothetical protein
MIVTKDGRTITKITAPLIGKAASRGMIISILDLNLTLGSLRQVEINETTE